MADLDDFFAKKDRKKSKGKKFMTTEEIAKKLEETGKKSEKNKKDKHLIQGSINMQEGDDVSEDEWKNFEEQKKDYSGLKIQNLTLEESTDSDNDGDRDRCMEDNGSGEMVPVKKGPWKVIEVEKQAPKENSTSSGSGGGGSGGGGGGSGGGSGGSGGGGSGSGSGGSNPPPSSNPTSQAYVPPHLRNQIITHRERPSRKKLGAPDINNQEFFPTLSAAKNETSLSNTGSNWTKKKQDGTFEEVRNSRSHSNRSDPSQRQQNLQIGNKFGPLESEHS